MLKSCVFFFTFWGPIDLWGQGRVQKLFWGLIMQLNNFYIFSKIPLILTFDFYLIFGSFFTFWGPNGLFLASVRLKDCFGVYSFS